MPNQSASTFRFDTLQNEGLNNTHLENLEQQYLPTYLKTCRWFGGKARPIKHIEVLESLHIPTPAKEAAYLFILQVFYEDATSELYQLPFTYTIEGAESIKTNFPKAVIAEIATPNGIGILYDAVFNEDFRSSLLQLMNENYQLPSSEGKMYFEAGKVLFSYIEQQAGEAIPSRVLAVEQSNTSVIYNNKFFLKLYRKLDRAINPDLEINRFFAEKTTYRNVPTFAGAIEVREEGNEPIVMAMMQEMIANQGDAWKLMLELVATYYEKVLTLPAKNKPPVVWDSLRFDFKSIHKDLQNLISPEVAALIALLGKRTAEMHLALASNPNEPDFAPKNMTLEYQNHLAQHLTDNVKEKLRFLQSIRNDLQPTVKKEVDKVLDLKDKLLAVFDKLKKQPIDAQRTRIHGDYHLGQVLFNGKDFTIIDFEGEPATPFAERRFKHSPLKDVAGMVRSFHYAVYATMLLNEQFKNIDRKQLSAWAEAWYQCARGFYLDAYLHTLGNQPLVPTEKTQMEVVLQAFLLEKAVYELCYEANNRPDWLDIPLNGILRLV